MNLISKNVFVHNMGELIYIQKNMLLLLFKTTQYMLYKSKKKTYDMMHKNL